MLADGLQLTVEPSVIPIIIRLQFRVLFRRQHACARMPLKVKLSANKKIDKPKIHAMD